MHVLESLLNTQFGFFLLLIAVFTVSLLESLAIVGLFMPGVALLFILATTAAHYGSSFYWLTLAAAMGAFLGDSLSYQLGRRSSSFSAVQQLLQRHTKIQQQAQAFYINYGAASLLIGRFIGPLRPFVPMTAGLFHFPAVQFYCIALLGAGLWAPVYLGPGYYFGYWPVQDLSIAFSLGGLIVSPYLLQHLTKTAVSPKVKKLGTLCIIFFMALASWVYMQAYYEYCGNL